MKNNGETVLAIVAVLAVGVAVIASALVWQFTPRGRYDEKCMRVPLAELRQCMRDVDAALRR